MPRHCSWRTAHVALLMMMQERSPWIPAHPNPRTHTEKLPQLPKDQENYTQPSLALVHQFTVTQIQAKTLQAFRHITSLKFFLFCNFLHLQQGSWPTLILLQTQAQIESHSTQPCQLWEGLMIELPRASPPLFIPTCPSGNRRAHLLA